MITVVGGLILGRTTSVPFCIQVKIFLKLAVLEKAGKLKSLESFQKRFTNMRYRILLAKGDYYAIEESARRALPRSSRERGARPVAKLPRQAEARRPLAQPRFAVIAPWWRRAATEAPRWRRMRHRLLG